MQTRKSGMLALVLGVAVLGFAACEGDTTVEVPEPTPVVTVNVTPDNVPDLEVGQTVTLVAVVSGTSNQAVTWTAAPTSVATVSAAGVVTAVAPGIVTVTAVSAADANARDAVSIRVVPAAGSGTPTVSIAQVNQTGTAVPVNPLAVTGGVDVVLNVDIPTGVAASAVRTLVNGVEVCRETFAAGGSADAQVEQVPVTIVCSFNTAQLLASGAARFPNGTYQIVAEVLGGTGQVLASATSQQFVFANVSFLAIDATASGATATATNGLIWATGDLTVRVTPAIFTAGTPAPASVTITVQDNGVENAGAVIAQRTVSTATNGVFEFTFTKAAAATGTNDVSEAEGQLTITANSVLGGQPGPTGAFPGPALRLDNQAPDDTDADATVAAFVDAPNLWYGANTAITSAARVANGGELSDEGVNINTWTFEFNANPAATNATAGWTAFTSPTALPQTVTTNGFRVRAIVCDALLNCATPLLSTASGGDVTAPTFVDATAAPDSIDETQGDAGTEIDLGSIVENLSGFPANFVQVRIVQTTAAGTFCIDPGTGAATAVPTGGCAFVAQSLTSVNLPGAAGDGYFEVTVQLVDNAGNIATPITRLFLVDSTDPAATVNAVAFSGSQVTVGGTATDNLEVASWDVRLTFGAAFVTSFPFTTRTQAGTFGLPLTTSVAVNGSAPLIREMNGNALTLLGFGVFDLANRYADGALPFGSPTPGDGFDNAAVIVGAIAAPTNSGTTICRTGTNPPCTGTGGVPATTVTSRTVTFTLVTQPNTANPAAAVYFYAFVPTTNTTNKLILIGSDNTGDLTITDPVTNNRNWTYSITLPASILSPPQNPGTTYTINTFAVVVDAEGDALVNTAGSALITVY